MGQLDQVMHFYGIFFNVGNGTPTSTFRSSGGLKLGDPLSPYFFVIGIEV